MRALRITGIVFVALLVLLVAGLGVAKVQLDSGFYDYYDAQLHPDGQIIEKRIEDGVAIEKLTFQSTPGEMVPTYLTKPAEKEERLPVIVFLHGIGQSGDFVTKISKPFNDAGFMMVSYDQYTRGERKVEGSQLEQAQAFRRRASSTVVDTRRLVDYLQTREDVDDERIYLIGASYGAITGSVAASMEPRIKATILVYGGGDLGKLLSAPYIAREVGGWLPFIIPAARYYLGVADPVRYVGGISPRPVLFQGGNDDGLVAPEAVQALYDAAQEPKEITWYPGDHIGTDEATVKQVLADGLAWLKQQDQQVLAGRGGAPAVTPTADAA